ncbi:MAG: hypothetical protein C4326_07655 [Ignavibacteria bacterium]
MRFRKSHAGIEVSVVTGTYVVILSIHMTRSLTKGLLGFAIEREDHTEHEKYFLKGFKYFAETAGGQKPGELFSTREHPVQSFFWEDFTAKPAHRYTYTLIPVYGKPKYLRYGTPCSVTVRTEIEYGPVHSVFFNRGVAGSLAYARRFGNRRPDQMSAKEREAALTWLSRGLKEAMLAFIGRAADASFALRGAVYEFVYDEVLQAFKQAHLRGADVRIVCDARKQRSKNEAAITKAGLKTLCIPRKREPKKIAHNKFIILLKHGKPLAVWTGSTNITEKGIFGQCNEGHIVNDQHIAQQFLTYWNTLATDPPAATVKSTTVHLQPDVDSRQVSIGMTSVFSPRPSSTMLQTYADLLDRAQGLVCGTFPFSFDARLKAALLKDTDHLKYVLIDRKTDQTKLETNDTDTVIAYGGYVADSLFDWLQETSAGKLFKAGTDFVHNKFLLIDPLGREPLTITGSANFSRNSLLSNDENTIIIRGDKRVADVYLTEFVRVFNHYYTRTVVQRATQKSGGTRRNPIHLLTTDAWAASFYDKKTIKAKRKQLFRTMPLR